MISKKKFWNTRNFFLTVGQNNFDNKIPFLWICLFFVSSVDRFDKIHGKKSIFEYPILNSNLFPLITSKIVEAWLQKVFQPLCAGVSHLYCKQSSELNCNTYPAGNFVNFHKVFYNQEICLKDMCEHIFRLFQMYL